MRLRTLLPLAPLLVAVFNAPVHVALASAAEQSAPQNRAAVVIDTGSEVKKVCVTFREAELSGDELLRRAKVQAVFAEYSIGTAVCALCGTGCPADDCFCESTTTGRYWNYSLGQGAGWQRSNLGASSTSVRNGDVQGWAWGSEGASPPWIGFESICVDVQPSARAAAPANSTPAEAPSADPNIGTASAASSQPAGEQQPTATDRTAEATSDVPASTSDVATVAPDHDATPVAATSDGAQSSGSAGVFVFIGGASVLALGFAAVKRRRI